MSIRQDYAADQRRFCNNAIESSKADKDCAVYGGAPDRKCDRQSRGVIHSAVASSGLFAKWNVQVCQSVHDPTYV